MPPMRYLALCADIPEAHLKGGGQADTDTQQHHGIPNGDPHPPIGAEGAFKHGPVYLQGVQLHDGIDDNGAQHQGAYKGDAPYAPGLPPG